MRIKYFFMILLLIVTIAIIIENNNYKLVIYFSVFSLIAASLYFYNHAPDVALAEIAVGSAFIPLIFLITISKQRTFTVMNNTKREFSYTNVLEEFCKKENLKLQFIFEGDVINDDSKGIYGVFRRRDIDLIIDYNIKKHRYEIVGKKDSILIDKFESTIKGINGINLIKMADVETVD